MASEREKAQAFNGGLADELRRLVAELLGTFALTLVAAGGEVIAVLSGGEVGQAARAVAPGLVVMALIYAIGDVSGAHFNPAVTLAFVARGAFPLRRLPGHWAAQFIGATLAALLLRSLFGPIAHVGATLPRYSVLSALVMEPILSWLLVLVILGTATRYRLVGPNAAIAVGATIALCGLFASPVSGASMNPAQSLGPAVLGGTLDTVWIYFVGPLIGASFAVLFTWILRGPLKRAEIRAAGGDSKRPREEHSASDA